MRFSKIPKFDPSEARTSGFTGPMGGKWVVGVVFRPKPLPEPNFTKIGLGHRTLVLHFLIFGLLNMYVNDVLAVTARPCLDSRLPLGG